MSGSSVRILGIAPYESMKTAMERTAQAYPELRLDVFTGDLQDGVSIVQNNLDNSYDCIISRGGTAELIRQVTDIPVVEIELSVYDVLRTIKLAENYTKRYAIVGFPSITKPAHILCDLLRSPLDIVTVHNAEETYAPLVKLRDQGYRMVVCDMVTQTAAHQLGMDALLITSGTESLQTAFEHALTLSAGFRRLRQENFFLRCVARDEHGAIAVLDEHGTLDYSMPEPPKPTFLEVLRCKCPEVPKGTVLRFYHNDGGDLYSATGQLVTIGQAQYYLFSYLIAKIPLRSNKMGVRFFNRDECAHLLNSSFYAISGALGAMEGNMVAIAVARHPVMITGEAGTGKEQIARYLYLHSPMVHNPFVVVDCELTNDKAWDFLLNHYNSPLNDREGTIYLRQLEALPATRQAELLSLILDAGLAQRQRLLFSCVCRPDGSVPEAVRTFALRLGCMTLELPNLRSRADEIPSLAILYLSSLNLELGKQISGFDSSALQQLRQFEWPNNYTQFRQVIQTLATLTNSPYISGRTVAEVLAQERRVARRSPAHTCVVEEAKDGQNLEEIVQDAIRQALLAHKGNQTSAARQLGISRTTLWRHLSRFPGEKA